jgi:hypothetical protein
MRCEVGRQGCLTRTVRHEGTIVVQAHAIAVVLWVEGPRIADIAQVVAVEVLLAGVGVVGAVVQLVGPLISVEVVRFVAGVADPVPVHVLLEGQRARRDRGVRAGPDPRACSAPP